MTAACLVHDNESVVASVLWTEERRVNSGPQMLKQTGRCCMLAFGIEVGVINVNVIVRLGLRTAVHPITVQIYMVRMVSIQWTHNTPIATDFDPRLSKENRVHWFVKNRQA